MIIWNPWYGCHTCAKALVMTHAYSNAIIDKVEEALKNGIVGHGAEHRLAEQPRLGGRHGVGIVYHALRKIYSSCKFIKKRGEKRET